MKKKLLAILFLCLLVTGAYAYGPPSVNPQLPAPNTPLNNAVVQGNFQKAYNDLVTIFGVLNELGSAAFATLPLPPDQGGTGLSSLCPSGQTIASNGSTYICVTGGGGGGGGGYSFEQDVTNGLSATTTFPATNVLWYSSASGAKTDNVPTATGSRQIITITDGYGSAGNSGNQITAVPAAGVIIGNASVYTPYGSITLYDNFYLKQWVSQ